MWLWIPQTGLGPKVFTLKTSVQLLILTCPPTCSITQLYPVSSFPLNGSCRNYFSSHFISIHHSTSWEKPQEFPPPNSASANPLGSSWRDTDPAFSYIFLLLSCSCLSPVWDTAADHFCPYSFLLAVPNLRLSYCVFFQYLCRKITGSTFLQLMQIWLEGNSSKWPHPWPQLDM